MGTEEQGNREQPRSAGPIDRTDRFDEFYAAYPRHVARKAAEKAWVAAIKDEADPQQIIDAAKRYAASQRDQPARYVKHPATWLNGACYLDEPDPPELRLVAGGYQGWTNPTDQSVYDEDL